MSVHSLPTRPLSLDPLPRFQECVCVAHGRALQWHVMHCAFVIRSVLEPMAVPARFVYVHITNRCDTLVPPVSVAKRHFLSLTL